MKTRLTCLALLTMALVAFVTVQPQTGHWTILKTKNEVAGRSECGMAASGGKLYVIGGDGPPAVDMFDPVTLTWTSKTAPPVEINHLQPVAYQGRIYVLAAFSGGGFPEQANLPTVYSYDTQTDRWTAGAGLATNRQRASAGAAVYGGKLYLVAGIQHGHSSGTTNMVDMYDPKTNQWTALPNAPHSRDHCAAAVVKNKLYVAGGRNTSYHEPDNYMAFMRKTVLEVDCYDFTTGEWTTLRAKLPLGSGGGSLVNLDDKLYYLGGERATETEANRPRKNTFVLDPASTGEWQETDSLQLARNGLSAAVLDHKIYVFGGAGGGPGGPPPAGGPGSAPPRPGAPAGSGGQPGPSPAGQMNQPGNRPPGPQLPSPLEVYSLK